MLKINLRIHVLFRNAQALLMYFGTDKYSLETNDCLQLI